MKAPGDDYSLRYSWREGSIPPPYHYEYDILFDSTGKGSVVMIPDYPRGDVPRWTEPFAVAPEAARALHASMEAEGLFTHSWPALDRPPVGGSHASLSVTAGDREVEIPNFVTPERQEHAARIYDAIRALVPQALWDKLEAQREGYIEQRQR